ncbi:MAG: NTP transferase domain-containing protein [Polyangiales bacterium]
MRCSSAGGAGAWVLQRLLPDANGVPLLARWIGLADAVGLVPCVVGDAAPYAALLAELERKRGAPITRIVDSPAGVGPLGGLRAVLAHAGDATVVVVACDMPAVGSKTSPPSGPPPSGDPPRRIPPPS